MTRQQEVRGRGSATLDIPAGSVVAATQPAIPVSPGIEKLADGFYSIASAATDAHCKLYSIDRQFQRIHGWSRGEGLSIVADARSTR